MPLDRVINDKTLRCSSAVISAVFALVFAGRTQAAVVASHTGDSDPANEGWAVVGPASGVLAGPLDDSGTLAWSVDDNSTVNGSFRSYSVVPPASAEIEGWSLRLRIRVVDTADEVDFSVSAGYGDSQGRRYEIQFGSNADGDPIVLLQDPTGTAGMGPSFTLQGASSTYHLYELVFDPIAGNADMFVDGVERISDYQGVTDTTITPFVAWGSRQSAATGHGRYNLVEFDVPRRNEAPALTTLGLAILTGLLAIGSSGLLHWRNKPPSGV